MTNDERHNEASRLVIAGVLDFPAMIEEPEIATLEPADFYGGFSDVWGKIIELASSGNLNTVRLVNSLSPASGYDLAYFTNLRIEFTSISSYQITDYAKLLRNYSARRGLTEIASRLVMAAHAGDNPQMVAGWAMDALAQWAIDGAPHDQPIADVLSEVFDDAVTRSANPRDVWGIPYGFPRLDRATGGLQTSELLIIGGEPGVGKTWFAIQTAMQASASASPGAFISLEMRKKPIIQRMAAILGVDRRRLLSGKMEQSDWQKLDAAIAVIHKLPITIQDGAIELSQLRPVLARLKSQKNIKWFVLDYLLLIGAPGKDDTERSQNISRELKLICNDLELAGIVLHSVNKQGMDAPGGSNKSRLRGSGQVVHDADLVYMLTKFETIKGDRFTESILPARHPKIVTLHVEKGRELEITGGVLHYERRAETPGFDELNPEETKW